MGRRRFLRIAVTGGGAALAAMLLGGGNLRAVRSAFEGEPQPNESPTQQRAWIMVVDIDRCDGCDFQSGNVPECTKACMDHHFAPPGHEYIKVYEERNERYGYSYPFVRPCMHCDDPPCRDVCPVGATFKRDDGLVLINHETCIGCRYCMAACPYQARYFNWFEPDHTPEELAHEYNVEEPWPHRVGVVDKCDFCACVTYEGGLPPCILACPQKALFFGDANEDAVSNATETVKLSTVLRERLAYRAKEELGTEPRVWYLAKRG